MLLDLPRPALDRAVGNLTGAIGLPCDLTDRAQIAAAAGQVTRPLAALVHCAGIFERVLVEAAGTEAVWDRMLAINLTAPFLLTRALLPWLTGGAVVTITSVRAETSAERAPAYTASKGGLAALTTALAVDLAPQGIRVNAVAPGDVATSMGRGDPAMDARLMARTPLARRMWRRPLSTWPRRLPPMSPARRCAWTEAFFQPEPEPPRKGRRDPETRGG
jgi:NAD(P)-dependent dehydrogenase (short-subunit alcohol dehydrogenase family)